MSRVQVSKMSPSPLNSSQQIFWPLTASLLGMALLALFVIPGVLKSHTQIWSAGSLLSLAIIFYVGSSAMLVSYLLRRVEKLFETARILVLLGFVLHTGAIASHWVSAQHPPISNIFEMLISFAWALVVMDFLVQRIYRMKILSAFVIPIATLAVLLSTILPTDPSRSLPPALQSIWLYIHVTFAIFSYVACAIAFVASILYLVKDRVPMQTFGMITQGLSAATLLGIDWLGNADNLHRHFNILLRGDFFINLLYQGRDIVIPDMGKTFLVVPLPWAGQMFRLSLLVSLISFALYFTKLSYKTLLRFTQLSFVIQCLSILTLLAAAQTMRISDLLDRIPASVLRQFDASSLASVATAGLKSNPFTLAGILVACMAALLFLILNARHEQILSALPDLKLLDDVNYKVVTIAFPLLTLMIATGAFWANRTWGSYWNWDPKEVGALITWLVYAAYLHMRIVRGWAGRRAAYFAIIGFVFVLFTFIGISYLLPGLHAYA